MNNNDKIIATFHNRKISDDQLLYPNQTDPEQVEFVYDLAAELNARNIKLIHILGSDNYLGGGIFAKYWQLVNHSNRDSKLREINEKVSPHLIFDKGHINFDDGFLHFFNSPQLAQLGRNKFTQSLLFNSIQPHSELLTCPEDIQKKLSFSDDLVVLKPLNLNGGQDIQIAPRSQLRFNKFPLLAQKFIESRSGIPGITSGRHDLRLYILNDKVSLASVRTPREGQLLSNVAQGGTIRMLSLNLIPDQVFSMFAEIDRRMSRFGARFYSADFMFDGTKWWLIEINDRPGVPALYQDTDNGVVRKFYCDFCDFLAELINEKGN